MIETTIEPIRTEWKYEYKWGLCSETTQALIIGLSIVISIKIVVSFILALKRKKDKVKIHS